MHEPIGREVPLRQISIEVIAHRSPVPAFDLRDQVMLDSVSQSAPLNIAEHPYRISSDAVFLVHLLSPSTGSGPYLQSMHNVAPGNTFTSHSPHRKSSTLRIAPSSAPVRSLTASPRVRVPRRAPRQLHMDGRSTSYRGQCIPHTPRSRQPATSTCPTRR